MSTKPPVQTVYQQPDNMGTDVAGNSIPADNRGVGTRHGRIYGITFRRFGYGCTTRRDSRITLIHISQILSCANVKYPSADIPRGISYIMYC